MLTIEWSQERDRWTVRRGNLPPFGSSRSLSVLSRRYPDAKVVDRA